MRRRPERNSKKKFIGKGLRMQILAWCSIVAVFMFFGVSFAWFTSVERTAESKTTNVMAPYYLTLLNPSETDVLQLSVGSLMPGRTKQIVFCVSNQQNEENELINMGGSDFDYSMELIHTNNLALNYTIYELEETEEASAEIVAEDTVSVDGVETTMLTYWKTKSPDTPLSGTDVSNIRHEQVELTGEEINSGTYIEYAKSDTNDLHLSDNGEGYDSQYFLMEIEWDDAALSSFEKYDKETDMIYILVKALLPEPE